MLDRFLFLLTSINDGNLIKVDFIEMWTNAHIQMEFEKLNLKQFWCAQLETFPQLARVALQTPLPFATNLFEMGFS